MRHHLLLCIVIAILAATGCSGNKEKENPFRGQMEQAESFGIWQDGKQISVFSRTGFQFWCSPSDKTIRILDNDGVKYTDLKLDEMPAESKKVNGTFQGNMGVDGVTVKNLYILKQDTRNVWLWSDDSNIGLLLPKYGIL